MVIRKLHRKTSFKNKINTTHYLPFFGDYIILSLDSKIIDKNEIEAAKLLINRHIKKKKKTLFKVQAKARLWVRCTFYTPYTKKGIQSRMGKGKGAIEKYICYINRLDPLFELANVSLLLAIKLFKAISFKLSTRICLVNKEGRVYSIKSVRDNTWCM